MSNLTASNAAVTEPTPSDVKTLLLQYAKAIFWEEKNYFAPVASDLRIEGVSLVDDIDSPTRGRKIWKHEYGFKVRQSRHA